MNINNSGHIWRYTNNNRSYARYLNYSGQTVSSGSSGSSFTFWQQTTTEDIRPGLIVTNRERTGIEISADKLWNDVPDEMQVSVTLRIYDVEIATGNATVRPEVLTLNRENNWHDSVLDLPNPAAGHTYAVAEAELPGFVASYDREGTIRVNGTEMKAYYTGAALQRNALVEVVVTNEIGTVLPQTGGIGTTLYTFGGLALMAGAAVCGYTLKRRRERGAE